MALSVKNNRPEIVSLLKATTPFEYLDVNVLDEIVSESKTAFYPRGSFIFREGEKPKKYLYLILTGQARAIAMVSGVETVTAVRNRGDYFGITGFLSDEPFPISMVASKDLHCLMINQRSFHRALGSSDRFADYYTKDLASRLKNLYKTISTGRPEEQDTGQSLLRQRIELIATRKVVTCLPMDSVRSVARKIGKANVSSVVVTGINNKPLGIITEKDLVKRIMGADSPNLETGAHEIMSTGLITVQPEDFAYKALLLMIKNSIKHLVVTDRYGALFGIVTIKDLVQSQRGGAFSIVKQIEQQNQPDEINEAVRRIDQLKKVLIDERSYASEICALVTELYDRVTRKIVQLTETEMIELGLGPPPVEYCFINMGSAGRKEQYSRTDQDNGIIYEDARGERVKKFNAEYFLTLGGIIVDKLEGCGFKRCSGKVMADNPCWCMPLTSWKNNLQQWVNKLDPAHIRNMTIFLDFRHITGKKELSEKLKEFTLHLFKNSGHALLFMAEDDLKHRAPLNFLGQFITERAEDRRKIIDLKRTVMVHLVDCLRLFALREGIAETNTLERLHGLKERRIFKPDDAEYIEAAYEALLMFRIRNAVEKMEQGEEPDNYIIIDSLSKKEKSLLKESLLMVNRLQSLTAHAFHANKI